MPDIPQFPFAALIGLEDVRELLQMVLVNPSIGPVAVLGPRGSGKTTAIRSLVDLLPRDEFLFACPSNCPPSGDDICDRCAAVRRAGRARKVVRNIPFVRMPLTATREDLTGRPARIVPKDPDAWEYFEPGLLSRANRGILAVEFAGDLEPGLLGSLLGLVEGAKVVLGSGGKSFTYPCSPAVVLEFDGDKLAPGASGRCHLAASSEVPSSIEATVALLKIIQRFDVDAGGLLREYRTQTGELRNKIARARERVLTANIPSDLAAQARKRALLAGAPAAAGALLQAAVAMAALEGKDPGEPHLEQATHYLVSREVKSPAAR